MKDIKAYWISGQELDRYDWINGYESDKYTAFAYRKDIFIESEPKEAYLRASAGYRYVFFINGKAVSYGPVRTYVRFKEYDKVDITPYLSKGINHLSAITFFSPSSDVEGSRDGFIAQINVQMNSGEEIFCTDKTWLFRSADWYKFSLLRFAKNTELQEHIDFSIYDEAWHTEALPEIPENFSIAYCPYGFRYKADMGKYKPVTVIGPIGTPPWVNFTESTVNHIEEHFEPYCVWQGSDSGKSYNIDENLAISFADEEKNGDKVNFKNTVLESGKFNLFTFDFERTRSVRPGIIIEEANGCGRVEFYYSRDIKDTPTVSRGFGEKIEGFCDSITLDGKPTSWKSLAYKGFRFLTVRVTEGIKIRFKLNCDTIEYPFGKSQKPKIDNEILSKLWDMAEKSIKSSTTDYYVDTCERENCLWTFDACVTGKAAYEAFGETKMWRHSLRTIARSIDSSGIPQSLAIPGDGPMLLFDQNMTWVHYCLDYYNTTKDISLLEEIYPDISRMLDYAARFVDENGMYIPPMYSWHYIDWAAINREPYSLPSNALFILANDAAYEISKILGKEEEGRKYSLLASRVRRACERFYDKEENAFLTHVDPPYSMPDYNKFSFSPNDKLDKYAHNLHANSLAIIAGVGDDSMRENTAKYIERMLKTDRSWASVGIGFVDLLFSPLLRYGMHDTVKSHIEVIFSRHVNENCPALGESIGSGLYNTAHGWGSTVISLISKLI